MRGTTRFRGAAVMTFLRQAEGVRSRRILFKLPELRRHARVSAATSERRNMDVRGVRVLLVGNAARKVSNLEDYLLKRGCDICFATSQKDALELLQRHQFDLVLSEFVLSDGTAYQLMPPLRGTDATMFFSNAVEAGCWWMNAIYEGKDRLEDPGMRPAQFRLLLDEILIDRLSRNANERQCKRREDRSNSLDVEIRKE
jgi:DNA-binding NtrC family response regulator